MNDHMHRLPNGWVKRQNGDIWDGDGPKARPVAYEVSGGWMVAGIRTLDELHRIVDILESGG